MKTKEEWAKDLVSYHQEARTPLTLEQAGEIALAIQRDAFDTAAKICRSVVVAQVMTGGIDDNERARVADACNQAILAFSAKLLVAVQPTMESMIAQVAVGNLKTAKENLASALKALRTIPCSCYSIDEDGEHRDTNIYCARTYAAKAAAEIEKSA